MSQMTEAAKKRMEEEISDYMMTHDRNNNENVFSPWSFRKGVEFGMQDPEANKELLEEMESFLEDLTSGSVSLKFSTSEGSKLLQKIREARKLTM